MCPWGQCWDHGSCRSGRGTVGFESQGNVRGTTGPRRRADLLVPTVVSRLHSTSCPLLSRNHLRGHQVGGCFSEALWPVFVPQCSPLSQLPMSQGPSSPGLCAEDRLSLDCPCPQHHVWGGCSEDILTTVGCFTGGGGFLESPPRSPVCSALPFGWV